jgi:hypothetical protein
MYIIGRPIAHWKEQNLVVTTLGVAPLSFGLRVLLTGCSDAAVQRAKPQVGSCSPDMFEKQGAPPVLPTQPIQLLTPHLARIHRRIGTPNMTGSIDDWQRHRSNIVHLYTTRKEKLSYIIRHMKENYGFIAR